MKRKVLKAMAFVLAFTSINAINVFGAIETRPVVIRGESFHAKWDMEYYESDEKYAQDIYKEIFGHDYTQYTTKKTYPMSGLKRIYEEGKYGDMIVFKKGDDTVSMVLKSADENTFEFYEAVDNAGKNQVMVKTRRYKADEPQKFMNERFKGGYFTIYHSEKYDEANHTHKPDRNGYCKCGSYDGKDIIEADFEIYIVKTTNARELPYKTAFRTNVLKISQHPDKVKGIVINGEGEIWYKLTDGWVLSTDVADEISGNITKPKVFEGYTAIVDDIDKLPVYSFNNEIYTVIGEIEKGKPVFVTKELPNWYVIDFEGREGYINKKFAEPVKA